MRPSNFLILVLTVLFTACAENVIAPPAGKSFAEISYPIVTTVIQTDNYHGTVVADPYRWMEDLDSAELKVWTDKQNALVANFLEDAPGREQIKKRMTELWDYERFGVPEKHGDYYFYTRNDGLQNQSPVYVQKGLAGKPRLLMDPNTLSGDGTVSLAGSAIGGEGKFYAYALSDGGSDWRTIKVRNVETGVDLADEIRWAKFTDIAWAKDASGFFYSAYDAPTGENQLKAVNKFQKVYFHKLGQEQRNDQLVYERKDQPDWGFGAQVSDDGRYLIITGSQGTDERNRLFYRDLTAEGSVVTPLIETLEAAYTFIGNVDDRLYLVTDNAAERSRVIAINLKQPGQLHWQTIVPESDAALRAVSFINRQFIAHYLRDARSEVKVFDLDGKFVRDIAMPALGAAYGFSGSMDDTETFFGFASFALADSIYRYDAVSGATSVFKAPQVKFDSSDYETRQAWYRSKDGTRIPMFISAKKGLPTDGNNPTILYGYGGFNIPNTPRFSPAIMTWMEMGGVYASANLRGGGEYGTEWHEAGMKLNKQNVFDDFAAAAEYLIAEKITQPKRLAISGRSNGGLLVAAALLQRPELFGAALPAVGVLDMLRFREFTIGWAWESDYGSVNNADEFKALYAYSPLHNIKTGVDYPPTLITTADHDDRVFPAHSFKFAAAMQAAYPNGNPILIRVETRAGHGAGKPTTKIIEETADMYAFLTKTLNMEM